ncbi:hypothetical protein BHE74_00011672 [Ensete ventricosum]|nr:hypothetical protein BHE74_00011672 [Ensete ventricosum]
MAMATALRRLTSSSSAAVRRHPYSRGSLCSMWTKQLNAPLEVVDPEIAEIIELEKARQWKVPSWPLVPPSVSLSLSF